MIKAELYYKNLIFKHKYAPSTLRYSKLKLYLFLQGQTSQDIKLFLNVKHILFYLVDCIF